MGNTAIKKKTDIFNPRADVSRGFCLLDSAWTAGLFWLYSRFVRAFSPENRQECYRGIVIRGCYRGIERRLIYLATRPYWIVVVLSDYEYNISTSYMHI